MFLLDTDGILTPEQLDQTGAVGQLFYLSNYKPLPTPSNGHVNAFVYEDGAQDVLDAELMQSHGRSCRAMLDQIGLDDPFGIVVHWAVDFQIGLVECAAALANIRIASSIASVVPGVYGSDLFNQFCSVNSQIIHLIQAAGWRSAHTYQPTISQQVQQIVVDGITCDVDEILAADWGQYPQITKENDVAASDFIVDNPWGAGFWISNPQGMLFAEDGAPYIGAPNTHPEWHAGVPTNPVVKLKTWDIAGKGCGKGLVWITQPTAPGTAPELYHIDLLGSPC